MLPVAISPCPNDTFLFYPWIASYIGKDLAPQPLFTDVDQLNQLSIKEAFPVIKVSMNCLGTILDKYRLLPVGSALGKKCGPLLIAKKPFSLEELPSKRIAIPGEHTTAHLLMQLFCPPPKEKKFCRYDQILSLLTSNAVDGGVIIHESRFIYKSLGFVEIADFGQLWDERFALPLPLGGIVAHRSLPQEKVERITSILKESLAFSSHQPHLCKTFVRTLSQEKAWEIIDKHLQLYVTSETMQISDEGKLAIETLLSCGEKLGWYTRSKQPLF